MNEYKKLRGACNPLLTNILLVVRGSEGTLCAEEGTKTEAGR